MIVTNHVMHHFLNLFVESKYKWLYVCIFYVFYNSTISEYCNIASRKSANESMSQSSYGSTMDIDMLNMDVSSQRPRAQQKRPIKESKGSRRTANIPTGTIAAKKLKYNEENCIPPKFLLNVKLDGNKATNKEVSPVYANTLSIFQTWFLLK